MGGDLKGIIERDAHATGLRVYHALIVRIDIDDATILGAILGKSHTESVRRDLRLPVFFSHGPEQGATGTDQRSVES